MLHDYLEWTEWRKTIERRFCRFDDRIAATDQTQSLSLNEWQDE